MSRAKWKGPFIKKAILSYLKSFNRDIDYKKPIGNARNSLIVPGCVGFVFKIHDGLSLSELKINSGMVGLKFGEFSSTRKTFSFKKKKKKRK